MICPECSARLHRSHSRNLKESLLKFFTPYKIYRCHDCNWRGKQLVTELLPSDRWKQTTIGWIIGIAVAIGIAWYSVADLRTNTVFPTAAGTEMKLP
jgi:hypothetical protein